MCDIPVFQYGKLFFSRQFDATLQTINMYPVVHSHTCALCKSYSRRCDLERHRNTIHAEDKEDPDWAKNPTWVISYIPIIPNLKRKPPIWRPRKKMMGKNHVRTMTLVPNSKMIQLFKPGTRKPRMKQKRRGMRNIRNMSTRVWMKRKLKRKPTRKQCGSFSGSFLIQRWDSLETNNM